MDMRNTLSEGFYGFVNSTSNVLTDTSKHELLGPGTMPQHLGSNEGPHSETC